LLLEGRCRCRERSLYCGFGGTMPSVPIEQIESRLSAVRCAICKKNQFGIDRRTMQPDGECKGVCLACRYSFPVHTDMEFYQRTQPDIPHVIKGIPCPKCQQHGVTLDFRIVLSVREAFYFVTCKACGHPFAEKSSLESFE
jgi:hypothetical protein